MLIAATIILSLSAQELPAREAFLQCREIERDESRLACFDAVAASFASTATALPAEPAAPPPRVAETAEPAAPPTTERETGAARFGLGPDRSDEPDSIAGQVSDITLDRYGKATITLANGQVWRQIGGSTRGLRQVEIDRIERATVKKAALGSHRIVLEPLGRSFKVRRIE